jgi:hypothetical protein
MTWQQLLYPNGAQDCKAMLGWFSSYNTMFSLASENVSLQMLRVLLKQHVQTELMLHATLLNISTVPKFGNARHLDLWTEFGTFAVAEDRKWGRRKPLDQFECIELNTNKKGEGKIPVKGEQHTYRVFIYHVFS